MPSKIRPFLWFDDNLDAALVRYAEIFGADFKRLDRHQLDGTPSPGGKTTTARFSLFDLEVMALQGGKAIARTPAFSFFVSCADQAEVDRYWHALTAHGGSEGRCGWLVDPFGTSWQIVPQQLDGLLQDPDPGRARRAMAAMLTMKKLDVAALQSAASDGGATASRVIEVG